MVAAGNHSQAPRVPVDRIQVKRELDVPVLAARVAVGVPARVAHIEVAVAARVVVVLAQQVAGHVVDSRVVQQRAQVLTLVDKGDQRRTLRMIVRLPVMPAAMLGPEALELGGDSFRFLREAPGKAQVAKRLKERALLTGELHTSAPEEARPRTASLGKRHLSGALE